MSGELYNVATVVKIYIQGKISKLGGVEVYTPNDVTIVEVPPEWVDPTSPTGLLYTDESDVRILVPWSRIIRVENNPQEEP